MQQSIAAGNDYLITVEGNQQTLLRQLETQFKQLPLSVAHQSERTRERVTQRTIGILDQIPVIDPQ